MKLFSTILNTIPRPFLIKLSYIARPFISFYLKGTKYTDPIDGKSFRKFLPYGYKNQRENVLSPSTLSLERHRLLWLYLKNETDFLDPQQNSKLKVLHMAPEQCFLRPFQKLSHEYITADLYSPIAHIKADITNLPFENDCFDVIFCNHVFEHIPDDTKAMQELYRVMKKGGMGIFQIPLDANRTDTFEDDSIVDPKERTKIFGQYDHVRVYGPDYFEKLRSIGFQVEEVNYSKKISAQLIDTYRLVKDEILPVVYKN
ncbi:MAG: Ubiquinone/menaquinone biosynthesis C-methyltransferase UbiE [Flavobacterium sp. SCGC AAA160-P02]|nr:MAG: Ubiquinone/menaquinone biosynthesis C-methyltransferase UbiE [Flavobacterium sp. SCGC AAA160-P02]